MCSFENNQKVHELLNTINRLSRNHTLDVVIRHSIREEIFDARNSHHVPLTEEGKKLAFEFGRNLPKDRLVRLFYSPVPRCKETADCIKDGIQFNSSSQITTVGCNFLGCPYMLKPQIVLSMVNNLGNPEFIKEWFNEHIDRTIIIPPKEEIKNWINSLLQCRRPYQINEINIYITHDWNVILLMSLLHDFASEDFQWPDYMDGIIIKIVDNQITIFHQNKEKSFQLNEFGENRDDF